MAVERVLGKGGRGVICSDFLESPSYFMPQLRLRNWAETKPADRTSVEGLDSQELGQGDCGKKTRRED